MTTPRLSPTPGWPINPQAADEAVARTRRVHARLRELDQQRIDWLRREAARMRATGDAALFDRAAEFETAADRMQRVLQMAEAQP